MRYESDCQDCLGGYYCEDPGAINFDASLNDTGTGVCAAGYYCKIGKQRHAAPYTYTHVHFIPNSELCL